MSIEHDEHNHFPIAAAVACMADATAKHDKAAIIRAGELADTAPIALLRGVAFLSECLEAYDDAPPMQSRLARRAIQEVTALCAVLIDVDNISTAHEMIFAQQGGEQ